MWKIDVFSVTIFSGVRSLSVNVSKPAWPNYKDLYMGWGMGRIDEKWKWKNLKLLAYYEEPTFITTHDFD